MYDVYNHNQNANIVQTSINQFLELCLIKIPRDIDVRPGKFQRVHVQVDVPSGLEIMAFHRLCEYQRL